MTGKFSHGLFFFLLRMINKHIAFLIRFLNAVLKSRVEFFIINIYLF